MDSRATAVCVYQPTGRQIDGMFYAGFVELKRVSHVMQHVAKLTLDRDN